MPEETKIDPPILIDQKSGAALALSTVEQVIEFVRRRGDGQSWSALRDAAFVAAAVPSSENLAALRHHAEAAFRALR